MKFTPSSSIQTAVSPFTRMKADNHPQWFSNPYKDSRPSALKKSPENDR